eukprot:UN00062
MFSIALETQRYMTSRPFKHIECVHKEHRRFSKSI